MPRTTKAPVPSALGAKPVLNPSDPVPRTTSGPVETVFGAEVAAMPRVPVPTTRRGAVVSEAGIFTRAAAAASTGGFAGARGGAIGRLKTEGSIVAPWGLAGIVCDNAAPAAPIISSPITHRRRVSSYLSSSFSSRVVQLALHLAVELCRRILGTRWNGCQGALPG